MTTFLVAAGDAANPARLERWAEVLRARWPAAAPLHIRVESFARRVGAVVVTDPATPSMVSTARRGTTTVVAYGRLGVADYGSAAATIARTWADGGRDAVTELDGAFGATIVDGDTVHILSDAVGTRTLRWIESAASVVVSPHDLALASTGELRDAWDATTARSLLAYRWSIAGASLHPAIAVGNGAFTATWAPGRGVQRGPGRALPRSSTGHDESSDAAFAIIDALETTVAAIADHSDTLRTTLTAGLDSRLTLALALRSFDTSHIIAETTGMPDDVDVREARRLSAMVGVTHEHIAPRPPTDLDTTVRDLAVFVNGQTSAKRALNRPEDVRTPTLTGQTAEIFRGRRWSARPHLGAHVDDRDQLDRLVEHFRQRGWKPLGTDLVDDSLAARMRGQLDEYRARASKPFDILDQFYVLDKTARWSSMLERDPAFAHVVSPFKMPSAVRHVTRLAPEWREPGHVHRLALERWSPRLLAEPINLVDLLPALDESSIARRSRQVRQRLLRRRRDRRASRRPAPGEYHAEALASSLDRVADIIGRAGGIGPTILGDALLMRLVDDQRAGRHDVIEELGQLWAMEVWRDEMAATIAAARV